jgi:hypothetical protein
MATQSGKESRRYFCPDCGVHLWVEVDAWPTILTLKVRKDSHASLTPGWHARRLLGHHARGGGQHQQRDQVVPACVRVWKGVADGSKDVGQKRMS